MSLERISFDKAIRLGETVKPSLHGEVSPLGDPFGVDSPIIHTLASVQAIRELLGLSA